MRRLPLVLLSGCIFITQADIDARNAGTGDGTTDTLLLGDDDDVVGDDDDDGVVVGGTWIDVRVGGLITCAISEVEEVRCWDDRDEVEQWIPGVPDAPGDPLFSEIVVSTSTGCALTDDGETRCFGAAGGTDVNPEPGIMEAPGTFDVVHCTGTGCCGITPAGELTCWDELPERETFGADLDGRSFVDVAGAADRWCAIEEGTGELVCFTTSSNNLPADLDWSDPDPPTGLYADASLICAANDDAAACWSSRGRGDLDVRDLDTVVSKQAYDNGGNLNLCGLQGGNVVCFTSAGQFPYEPTSVPEGDWVHLSMQAGNGCVLDGEGQAACWGDGSHLPHNQ